MSWKEIGPLSWISDMSREARPLSAGSGLVRSGGALWIVADDLHHIVRLENNGALVGVGHRIFSGELPEEHKARKRAKPDTECLIALPSNGAPRLLAFPSGSKRHRTRAVLIELDAAGAFANATQVDLSSLLHFLDERIPDLNIEGGVTLGDNVLLLQRGNGEAGFNGVVTCPLARIESCLHGAFDAAAFNPSIREISLPKIDGERLTFTDATTHEGAIYFAAAAERSASTYDDGEVAGSAIGRLEDAAVILAQKEKIKVEGVTFARGDDRSLTFFGVTDADDAAVPSLLLEAQVARRSGARR